MTRARVIWFDVDRKFGFCELLDGDDVGKQAFLRANALDYTAHCPEDFPGAGDVLAVRYELGDRGLRATRARVIETDV